MDMPDDCWDHVGLLQDSQGAEHHSHGPQNAPEFMMHQQPYHHELLVSSGQPTTATSPAMSGGALSPGALSPSSTATTTTTPTGVSVGGGGAGAGASTPGTGATGPSSCCENGRPMMTDPVTGQTVCSCQYDSAARLALGAYPRLGPPATTYTSYPTPTPSAADQGPYPSIGMDSSAFYSPLSNPYALKDATGMGMTTDMGAAWGTAALQPATAGYYPYDPTLAAYGYGAGYDLAARRKNATRESTATLKAWLNEHKKNPYPTKGEKIMLAIITKMTLTQVSTWFANARRRLKKENKMTWEPKNKTDDDDDAALSDPEDNKDKDLSMHADNRGDVRAAEDSRRVLDDNEPMRRVKSEHIHHPHHQPSQHDKDLDDEDDLDLEDDPRRSGAIDSYQHHQQQMQHHHHPHQLQQQHQQHHHPHHPQHHGYDDHHHHQHHHHLKEESLKSDCSVSGVPLPATKPKIWSLADTAACKTPPPHPYQLHHPPHQQTQQQHQQQYVGPPPPPPQQQQQQHMGGPPSHHHHHQPPPQQQQPWLGAENTQANNGGNLNSFALPSSASMSPSSAATAPYSGNSTRGYGGFLSTSSGGQLGHYNPNSSGNSNGSATSSAAAGFPEVGTDTPPQTPPNMKVATTPNGTIQAVPPTASGYSCPGGNPTTASSNNPAAGAGAMHYPGTYAGGGATPGAGAGAYASRLQNSPHKEFASQSAVMQVHQHQTTASLPPTEASTAFKPFYKGTQSMGSGFVSPV